MTALSLLGSQPALTSQLLCKTLHILSSCMGFNGLTFSCASLYNMMMCCTRLFFHYFENKYNHLRMEGFSDISYEFQYILYILVYQIPTEPGQKILLALCAVAMGLCFLGVSKDCGFSSTVISEYNMFVVFGIDNVLF